MPTILHELTKGRVVTKLSKDECQPRATPPWPLIDLGTQ